MVRAQAEFIVVSPEKPEDGGPVMAMAPRIFLTELMSPEHLVPLPPMVDGVRLFRGVVLQGFGRIFKQTGAEVMPEDLKVVTVPENRRFYDNHYPEGDTWD